MGSGFADYPKVWPQPTKSLATSVNWPVEPYEQEKQRSFADISLLTAKLCKLACREGSPDFSCAVKLSVGNGQSIV
jgi:hypothetical protein